MTSVTDSAKTWCAGETLRMAAEALAKRQEITPVDAFLKLVASPVYDAIYDLDTGMWGEGPAMLLDAYSKHPS